MVYFLVLISSFALSFISDRKSDKSLNVFPFLLALSIVTEIITYSLHYFKVDSFLYYHIYLLFEYSFLAVYFYLNSSRNFFKRAILISIPVFVCFSLFLSFYFTFKKYPGIQINTEGLLIIIFSIITLFSIDINVSKKIYELPVFWICIAFLIYYSGIFTFNGLFNFLKERKSQVATQLIVYILQTSNYILYICLSIAFICSHRTKK
jgi:hypothetical protein